MKWPFLAFALAAILPLTNWLRLNSEKSAVFWMFVGLLPFVLTAVPHTLYIAVISWVQWPGFVKGAELTALDIVGIAVFFSQSPPKRPLPFKFSALLYFLVVLGSAFFADVPTAVFFYAWQLARVFLIYSVVARASSEDRVVYSVLNGMAIGLCIQAFVVVWQRFASGEIQATGTFGHQNALGFLSQFVVFPYFALMLARNRGWQTIAVPIAGTIVAVLTASRATVGLLGFGFIATFILSAASQWTSRKLTVALVGIIFVAALTPFAISTFERRFQAQIAFADSNERAEFEAAAWMMLSDHPMGVGANNFVVIANTGGYYERAGVAPVAANRAAEVHDAFLLVAAETGYLGLVSFLMLLLRLVTVAFRCGWRNRQDRRGELLLGLSVSLLVAYIHSFVEWELVTAQAQYTLAITAGLVAGLATQLGYWGRLSPGRSGNGSVGYSQSSISGAGSARLKFGGAEVDFKRSLLR